MTALDRMTQGYEPNFDLDLQVGKQGELFVTDIARMLAEGTGQIEVKYDYQSQHTGNVYIEYACRRAGGWQPSGVATSTALLWAFVLPARILIAAPTGTVRDVARKHLGQYRRELTRGSHPTKGVAIPLGLFVQELGRYEVAGARMEAV